MSLSYVFSKYIYFGQGSLVTTFWERAAHSINCMFSLKYTRQNKKKDFNHVELASQAMDQFLLYRFIGMSVTVTHLSQPGVKIC